MRQSTNYHRLRGLAAALALGLLTAAAQAAADGVSLVAFNVESDGSSDYVIGKQLAASQDIDLWVLTEVWDHQWPERLTESAAEANGLPYERLLGKSGGDNRVMFLYRPDRLELLASEELMDMPRGRGESVPLAVRFRGPDGAEFEVLGVRLSKGRKRAIEQATWLNEWIAERDTPVIAAGSFFFNLRVDADPADSDGYAAMTAGDRWVWLRPGTPYATDCAGGGRVNDFVFVSSAASDLPALADVMYRQSNYCADDELDRRSGHRPVLARVSPTGTELARGSLPERPVSPLLPGVVFVRDLDEDGEPDERAEYEPAATGGSAAPAAEPAPAGTATPEPPAAAAGAAAVGTQTDPETDAADDPDQQALEERLEALEREAAELREALERQQEP